MPLDAADVYSMIARVAATHWPTLEGQLDQKRFWVRLLLWLYTELDMNMRVRLGFFDD